MCVKTFVYQMKALLLPVHCSSAMSTMLLRASVGCDSPPDQLFASVSQGSVEHCIIGVQILSQLVCEMNQVKIKADVIIPKWGQHYGLHDTHNTVMLQCLTL